jgi:hypothetical protein
MGSFILESVLVVKGPSSKVPLKYLILNFILHCSLSPGLGYCMGKWEH